MLHVQLQPACDRLFSVGDLVDRGEHAIDALALLDFPWFFAVKGNHEEVMCDVADGMLPQLADLIQLEHDVDAAAVPVVLQVPGVVTLAQQRGAERGQALAVRIAH